MDVSRSIIQSLKLFFEEQTPLFAAVDEYRKVSEQIDVLIARKTNSSFVSRTEKFYQYYIESLLIEYEIGILSANRRIKDFIKFSHSYDIHKTNQLYIKECAYCKIEFKGSVAQFGPFAEFSDYQEFGR